jgi:CBS domain-containing protein
MLMRLSPSSPHLQWLRPAAEAGARRVDALLPPDRRLLAIPADADVGEALDLGQRSDVRQLLVAADHEVIGVVPVAELRGEGRRGRLRPVATRLAGAAVIPRTTPVAAAATLLRERAHRILLVADEQILIGVVTRADLRGAGVVCP